MKNRFFELALASAARLLGKPARLVTLAARFLMQLDRDRLKRLSVAAVREKFRQLGRLVAAYARGEYRHVPVKTMLIVTAALVYFLNPLDFVPDAIPALGLADDFAVLSWVYQRISSEMSAFLEWERSATSVTLRPIGNP